MVEDNELEWYHLAVCRGMNDKSPGEQPHTHKDYFAEEYENDPVMAQVMDGICLSCPVRKMCLREGIEGNEYGLWGGVYLVNGKMDETKNAHKSDDVWNEIRNGILNG